MCQSTNKTSDSAPKIKSKIVKKRGRGQRGKELRNNICNSISYLRRCPPRTCRQAYQVKYHRRISRIFADKNYEASTSWKPNDLHCAVCNISVTGKKQLLQHFKNTKHNNNLWKCTPKYCDPCGIYYGFSTKQLWEAHISSRKHNLSISKLPPARRQLSEYGFTN